MKTVPTLCATATVVGASAVGLSFGRETPFDSSRPNKRKVSPAPEPYHTSMPTAVQTTARTTIAPSYSAPIPVAPTTRIPFSSRSSQDGRTQNRLVRRMTSEDVALPPSTIVHSYAPSDQDITESEASVRGPTRRTSWMKRISTISNSSRNPSPSPLSPALSYSNGSMAFSQDGSTAPIVGKRSTSPMPPNKLVKRSSSVRGTREPHAHGSASLRPSFRRPATSHQRSKTLQQHTTLLEMTVENPIAEAPALSASTDSEVEYAQFFKSKMTKERILAKRRGSSANVSGFRRIFPDEKHAPTLVLARAVSAGAEEAEDLTSDEGESIFVVSRPGTPLSFTAVFAAKREPSQSRPSSHIGHHDDTTKPRRSFSITDLFTASGARKRRASREPAAKGPRRVASQRVSSAPLVPTVNKRPISASFAEVRRELLDSAAARRDMGTAAGAETAPARNGPSESPSSSPLPATTVRRVDGVPELIASAAAGANHMPPSPTLAQPGVRPSRYSMTPSEQASTLVGSSDNELRGLGSGDEDDADFHSETLFDSLRTGATRSTSGGARGPRIETIFDESPPSKPKVTALRDLLPPGAFGEHTTNGVANHQSIAEEEESIATPVRTVRAERSIQNSPSYTRTNGSLFANPISSSPPSMPKPLSLGTLEWDASAEDDDDSSRWSLDDDDIQDPWIDHPAASHAPTPVSLLRQNPRLFASGASSKPTTPLHLTADHGDRDARSSIFDWSEQHVADKKSSSRSPPRPRTVHGKKDADRRGSRSVGRRVPSGLHARSQSVPVVPDATGKRSTVVTNKFGTWGVGSKGVTEDWNDDFDFSELAEEPSEEGSIISPRIDSGTAMVVPKNIQEQQNNVLANIGLLREWGLLIEELKEHRVRAVALGIVEGPHSSMWEEVDAMIDLADQEAEHEGVAGMSPPSSPGFDEDAFDDGLPASPSHGRGRRKSSSPKEDAVLETPQTITPKRKSILPPNDEIFAPQSSPVPPKVEHKVHEKHDSVPIMTRPRKDSEAKARSVIEALQSKRRSIYDPILDAPPTPSSKKVPFDTATLRRIVPYVNILTRKVKQSIRDAEGLYSSPRTSPQNEEPSFSKMFVQDDELAKQMKLMTVT